MTSERLQNYCDFTALDTFGEVVHVLQGLIDVIDCDFVISSVAQCVETDFLGLGAFTGLLFTVYTDFSTNLDCSTVRCL